MKISPFALKKFRDGLSVVLLSIFLGALFACAMSVAVSGRFDPQNDFRYIMLGSLTGFGVSSGILLLNELFLKKKVRPLWFSLLITPFLQTAVISLVYASVFISLLGYESFWKDSYLFQTVAFSLLLTVLTSLYADIERLLGRHVLRGLLFGTYSRPRNENRFVMFLDLAGSTAAAESLGSLKFHAFLNDFFCDIARPIINHGGEIYKYVGDEVIITWPEKSAGAAHNPLNVFFAVSDVIQKRHNYYKSRYGLIPHFRAGLHFGSIVAGEMGLTRQEIAFSGDVMNTTARIQSECRLRNEVFLVSGDALSRLSSISDFPSSIIIVSHGVVSLRGKSSDLAISAVCSA